MIHQENETVSYMGVLFSFVLVVFGVVGFGLTACHKLNGWIS